MRLWMIGIVGLAAGLLPRPGFAQPVPFFGGGVVAFDPEISVIQSGALLDAQAVVSDDRKYVTLNMRPSLSRLQSLQTFPVSSIANSQGFVGGVNLPSGKVAGAIAGAGTSGRGAGAGGAANALTNPSPDAISRAAKSWVFTRQGMYLVTPLQK